MPCREHMIAALPLIRERVAGELMDLQPWTCMDCPFGAKTREPYHEIWNDPSEAHYLCPVYQEEVWGENPTCSSYMHSILVEWLTLNQRAVEDTTRDQ